MHRMWLPKGTTRQKLPSISPFLGAQIYKVLLAYYQTERDFASLDLDRLAAEPDISESAKQAERLLAQADLGNVMLQSLHHTSKALVELLEVHQGVATRVNLCFKAAFKPDLLGFAELRAKIRRATDHLSKAGASAVPIIRQCDTLLARVNNLERLARAKKTDFGIYSGLISSALFVPLVLAASWTNKTFDIGLDGKMLILTVVALSLIGGFGFGALRFKSVLFPAAGSPAA